MAQQDLQCPFCPKVSTRGTGLASHIRGAHSKQYAGWSKARKAGAGKPGGAIAVTASAAPASVKSGSPIGSGFGDIVTLLEQQRSSIEAALAALRGVGSIDAPPSAPAAAEPAKRGRKKGKGGMTPEGKARLIAALKRRWAERKAAAASGLPTGKRGPGRPKKT
jgi:hypothetical protein